MTCFNENYIHEIPTDIQLKIMNIVKEEEELEREEELEWVVEVYDKIQNAEEDVIYILRCMTDGYNIESKEEFDDTLVKLVRNCCEEEHDVDNFRTLINNVHRYGIFSAMKLGMDYFDMDFDIQGEEIILYQKCYYAILTEAFNYEYEDYKLIKKYNISTM